MVIMVTARIRKDFIQVYFLIECSYAYNSKINESTLNNHLLIEDPFFLQAPMEITKLRRNKLSKIRCRVQGGRDGHQEISVGRPPHPNQPPHPVARRPKAAQ